MRPAHIVWGFGVLERFVGWPVLCSGGGSGAAADVGSGRGNAGDRIARHTIGL